MIGPICDFNNLRSGLNSIADQLLFVTWSLGRTQARKTKPPKIAHTRNGELLRGSYSSYELPKSLMTLEEAISSAERFRHQGVGIAFFPECGVVGLDLDSCIVNGEFIGTKEQKQAWETLSPVSFTELSYSGEGVHAVAIGNCATTKANGVLELFGSKNFLALTGIGGKGVAARASGKALADIAASIASIGGVVGRINLNERLNDDLTVHLKSLEGQATMEDVRDALTYIQPDCDRELWLRIIWGIRHGLGDSDAARDLADQWSSGTLQSRIVENYIGLADVMTSFEGYDPNRVDGITVGTVFKVAQDNGWTRVPQTDVSVVPANSHLADIKKNEAVQRTFGLTDGDICIPRSAPPKRDFVFADTVTKGALSVIAGSGGVSKTTLAMQIAVSMAAGISHVGFQVMQGAVVAFLGEEDSEERDRRFGSICQQFNADPDAVARYVKAFPSAGIDLRLTQVVAGSLCSTDLVDEIIGLVKDYEEAVGREVELIIVDHARLAMDGDPNDAAHVTQLTRALTHVAQETKAAVVLLCHSPKNVLSKDSDQINASDVAGSSAFVDNARSAFMLYGMRPKDAKAFGISESEAKKYVKFECVKANYAPTGSVWWFERKTLEDWQTAVLQPANLVPPMFAPGQAKVKLRQAILDFVSSNPGKSQRQLRLMAGKTKRFGASERDLVEALDVLLDEGRLSLRKPTTDECKRHRITPGKAYLFS
jgi:RecA-family ATPase